MMLNPHLLLKLAQLHQQDRQREAEIWRLTREARQGRAKFLSHLAHRLLAAAREQLRIQTQRSSAIPDIANSHR